MEMINLLEQFPPEKYNLLYPSETAIPTNLIQRPQPELVRISPVPEDGEVFSVGNVKSDKKENGKDVWVKKLALTKTGLEKLSHVAGIVFDPHFTGKVETGDPRILEYRAHGALQKPDGSWIDRVQSVTVNLNDVEDKLRADLEDKAKDGKLGLWKKDGGRENKFFPYAFGSAECTSEIEKQFRQQAIQQRLFAGRKAESGAQNRVIRALLGLKPSYTVEELLKSFVVIRITLNVEALLADPVTRQQLVANAMNASQSIFGGGRQEVRLSLPPANLQTPMKVEAENITAEVVDEAKSAVAPATTIVPEPTPAPGATPATSQATAAQATDSELKEHWTSASAKQRIEKIGELLSERGFSPKEGTRKPEEMKDAEQVGYIIFLTKQPIRPQARKAV